MNLDNLPLPYIIRYGLAGLVGILAFLLPPLAVFRPSAIQTIETVGGVTGLIVLSFALGFILDALKLYQLVPGYQQSKKDMFKEISVALGVSDDQAGFYFAKALRLERDRCGGPLFLSHARWVLMATSCVIFFSSALAWLALSISLKLSSLESESMVFALLSIFFIMLSMRLYSTSKGEQRSQTRAYLQFFRENKEEIMHSSSSRCANHKNGDQ